MPLKQDSSGGRLVRYEKGSQEAVTGLFENLIQKFGKLEADDVVGSRVMARLDADFKSEVAPAVAIRTAMVDEASNREVYVPIKNLRSILNLSEAETLGAAELGETAVKKGRFSAERAVENLRNMVGT